MPRHVIISGSDRDVIKQLRRAEEMEDDGWPLGRHERVQVDPRRQDHPRTTMEEVGHFRRHHRMAR